MHNSAAVRLRMWTRHDNEGGQERFFTAHAIANVAKKERSNRSNRETNGESREGFNEAGGGIVWGIKLVRQDRRERSEDEEIVPLDHRSGAGCDEDGAHGGRGGRGDRGRSHARSCGHSDWPATLRP